MTKEAIREALEQPTKASRKALAKMVVDLEADDPERYQSIVSRSDWTGDCLPAFRSYGKARIVNKLCMILAVLVVIAAYVTGEYGMRLFTGWLNRYILAIGVTVAMALFAGSTLYANSCKERWIAYALLEEP